MRPSRGPLVALVGLLILDVALVAFAFKGGPPPVSVPSSAARSPSSSSTGTVTPSRSATSPITTSPSASATTGQPQPQPQTLSESVVAIDGSTAWRLTLGSCAAGGSAMAISSDSGKTWVDRKSPFEGLIRVQPTDGTTAFVVGADKDCRMGFRRTADGAQTWSANAGLGDTWARDMADPTKVKTPGSRTTAPCGPNVVLDLMRIADRAAQALCRGGVLQETNDDGASWAKVGTVDGAIAFDNRVEGGTVTAYVVAQTPQCAGLTVVSVQSGAATPRGCVATGATTLTPGTVSVSVVGNDGWLVTGKSTWRSRDAFRTWTKA